MCQDVRFAVSSQSEVRLAEISNNQVPLTVDDSKSVFCLRSAVLLYDIFTGCYNAPSRYRDYTLEQFSVQVFNIAGGQL